MTVGYAPQQNGKAERWNRTLIEGIRTVLIDSGLPLSFWEDDMEYITFTRNRCPIASKKRVPFHAFYGKRPNTTYLRRFRIRAFAHIGKSHKRKLDPINSPVVILGYQDGVKGYKVLDLKTGRVTQTDQVVFTENNKVSLSDVNKVPAPSGQPIVIISREFEKERTPENVEHRNNPEPMELNRPVQNPLPQEENPNRRNVVQQQHPAFFPPNLVNELRNRIQERNQVNENLPAQAMENQGPVRRYPQRRNAGINSRLTEEEYDLQGMVNLRGQFVDLFGYQVEIIENMPQTYRDAMKTEEASAWTSAMEYELETINRYNTATLTDLPPGKKLLTTRWVLNKRAKPDSEIQHKARLCVRGFEQREGIDFKETFAPTLNVKSFRILCGIAAKYKYKIRQFDVKSAFLNGILDEEIYVTQPPGFEDKNHPEKVWKLNRALYGLKQSPRIWWKTLQEKLTDIKLISTVGDDAMFSRKLNGKLIYIGVWVDDMPIAVPDDSTGDEIKNILQQNFEIHDLGDAKKILGMELNRNNETGTIRLTQSKYIKTILAKFEMSDCKPVDMPFPQNLQLNSKDGDALPSNTPYRELVGSLIHAMNYTRPNIAFAVSVLSRYMQSPRTPHWKAAKHVLRYLRGSTNCGIEFSGKGEFFGAVDSDWGMDIDTNRSTTGYTFMFAGGPISWKSKCQKVVSDSSTEAELRAAVDAVKECKWLRDVLSDLAELNEGPTRMFEDNQGLLKITENTQALDRCRHISRKASALRESIQHRIISLEYIASEKNPADIFTKSVHKNTIKQVSSLYFDKEHQNKGECQQN